MLQTSLSKTLLEEAARQLQEELSFPACDDAFKKGLKLYREGFVYNAVLLESEIVQADVLDERVYKPLIHLTNLSESRCPCSDARICPHILALFFYVYANVGPVGELVRQWVRKPPSAPPKLAKARDIDRSAASARAWLERFQRDYDGFLSDYRRIDYWFAHHACNRFFPSLLNKAPRGAVEKPLYHLYASLFTFCRLLEHGEQFERFSYQRSYWESTVADFVGTIQHKCDALKTVAISAPHAPMLEELREYVRDILLSPQGFQDMRIRVYQIIWEMLSSQNIPLEQEQERLQEQAGDADASFARTIAWAHLAFLRGRDEEVFASLAEMHAADATYYMIVWLRKLERAGQWQRMKSWWPPLIDQLGSFHLFSYQYKMQISRELLRILESCAEALNDWSDYERLLQTLLPYSAYDYSLFLIESKQYKKWVDLHLLADIDIENIQRAFLTAVEKHDRALLLPLYHHGVQKMLLAKNRPSYKRAVKYLKKLRTHYRALGRYDTWLMYRDRLLQDTKRLRAFQEELQKGKLLHD